MFLFESIPWYSAIMWFVVLGGLMLVNEIARLNKWFSLAIFLVLPIVLTFTVWPKTAGSDSSVGNWFHWAKVYSCLAGALGFLFLRFIKKLQTNKLALFFPAFILAVNIMEAVAREFQFYACNGNIDGVTYLVGPWNIMNAVAGILSIITISGWTGIIISKDKHSDMVWPDMMWFWVIAYDLWNFAYIYNCIPHRAFYAGAALLISATLPAFMIKKGAWLQHRAQTLAIWMMFIMCFSRYFDKGTFAVGASNDPAAFMFISILAIGSNIAVFIYHFYKVFKYKRNPITTEVHSDLAAFQKIAAENQ